MKLFLLVLCCVVVLTTSNADLKSREELEKVLDELSNALVTADEAETEEVLGKGNEDKGASTAKDSGTDTVQKSTGTNAIDEADGAQEKFIDSINNAKDDDEAFANLIQSDAGDDNFEEDFLNWVLDEQALDDDDDDDDDIMEMEDNDWDNMFDADVQERSADDFDTENRFSQELDANVADAFRDEVKAMNADDAQASEDDDHFARAFDNEVEEMNLDDDNSLFDMSDTMGDDSETADFLKVMKAADGKDSIDNDFEDFVNFVESSDIDNVEDDDDDDDFVKLMSEVGDTTDNTDDDFNEFLDEMESGEIQDDDEDDDFDSLLALAQKITHTDEDTKDEDTINSEDSNLAAAESADNEKSTVSTTGRRRWRSVRRLLRRARRARRRRRRSRRRSRRSRRRSRRARRRSRRRSRRSRRRSRRRIRRIGRIFRRIRRIRRVIKPHKIVRRKIIRRWRRWPRNRYYRRYKSTLKKYYRLKKKYYSLNSKYRRVKRACKKTTFKIVSNYCKKVHKKMNDYSKVYSKVRGCRNTKKCKFYEKTTNKTRNYYNFMYKIRPTAVMCNRLIKQTRG